MAPQHPTNVGTVYVPVWTTGKEVYRRGLEIRLSEAVAKRIQQITPYRIADKTHADTELSGTVELIPQKVLSFNPDTGLPRELEMTIVVNFVWKDLRSGKIIVKRNGLRSTGTYIPHEPFGEEFFQGSEDVINRLAERVVEQMEKDWEKG
jgi:hypothetical protein